ncbi:phenylalanine--tRNA ligase subunit beta [Patescibacteria group bacterium]|nr:phenylalanine--tRNA ligase subunit beta [Patescibacteria group bacterium]
MKISLNWLKQYVDIPKGLDPKELALKLTMSTVEVEEVIDQRERYQNMVIGEIVDITDHPQADKLKVCKVNAGKGQKLQVICGADNIRKGMKGILALPGAMVKWHGQGELVKLEKTKIRGVESSGMLCAPSEVSLAEEFKEEEGVVDLGEEGKVGQPIAEALGFDDVIFNIDNKSITHRPDLWGHYGLAREIAALLNKKLKDLKVDDAEEGNDVDLKIKIEDKENCFRYIGAVIGNIKVEPSPLWMQTLLTSAGMRPINNIVDITNYVMLELGRPSHAFDRREIKGDAIIVRRAKQGEKFKTLDGQERGLTSAMCLVCDSKRAVDLAGIMGGENSEIKNDTTEIILELANFNPVNIRKTSTQLGLRTESAARFEKSLDPSLAELGMKRIITLIKELIPRAKVISRVADVNYGREEKRNIELDLDFLNRRIGQKIPKKEVISILENLSFQVKDNQEKLLVIPPSFRTAKDISIPEDLVEEVARIYGYDKIIPVMPLVSMETPAVNNELVIERKIKDILSQSLGAAEVYNYSFTSEKNINQLGLKIDDHLELANSISQEQKYLRQNLFENLVANLESNLRFFDELNIFEIGRVYLKEAGNFKFNNKSQNFLPRQEKYLAGLKLSAGKEEVFYQAKGIIEIILKNLEVDFEFAQGQAKIPWIDKNQYLEVRALGQIIGFVSKLNPRLLNQLEIKQAAGVWELNFNQLLKYAQDRKKYQPLPKFPKIIYDLSLIVPKAVLWENIEKEVYEASPLINKVELFDVYEIAMLGPDKRSLAFHVYFQSQDRTLEAREAEELREKIIKLLNKKFKAEARRVL